MQRAKRSRCLEPSVQNLPNPQSVTDEEFVRIGGQALMYESLPAAWQIEALERINRLLNIIGESRDADGTQHGRT